MNVWPGLSRKRLEEITKEVIHNVTAEAIAAQWDTVSVHDQLPTPLKSVLWWNVPLKTWHIGRFCPSKDYPPGYFEGDDGHGTTICYVNKGHVTHWAQLPPPPTELDT